MFLPVSVLFPALYITSHLKLWHGHKNRMRTLLSGESAAGTVAGQCSSEGEQGHLVDSAKKGKDLHFVLKAS